VPKQRFLVVLVGSLLFVGPMARSSNNPCDEAFHVEQLLGGHIRISGLDFYRPADGWGVGFQPSHLVGQLVVSETQDFSDRVLVAVYFHG
jgi:hypothetical protein